MNNTTPPNAFAMLLITCAVLLASGPSKGQGAEKLFDGADRKAGMTLHRENNCVACHAQRLGGDGSAMYTRPDRKVTTPQKLLAQIAVCNTQLSTAMFPEDERDVAAYLNHNYYHFK